MPPSYEASNGIVTAIRTARASKTAITWYTFEFLLVIAAVLLFRICGFGNKDQPFLEWIVPYRIYETGML
jgi:hypothetical protein